VPWSEKAISKEGTFEILKQRLKNAGRVVWRLGLKIKKRKTAPPTIDHGPSQKS
jgi:hypothetical protein